MTTLSLGYSPCPNDTFIFCALANNFIDLDDFTFQIELHDVEALNRFCENKRLDVTKLSVAAIGLYQEDYALLRTGSALGRGCGPLMVAQPGKKLDDLAAAQIAIPGPMTTAHLLLTAFLGQKPRVQAMPFDQIMPAVARGEFPCGLIIHEGRFTYQNYGLVQLQDLGVWWEIETGLPIPLGGIALRRELGRTLARQVNETIERSLAFALNDPSATDQYVRDHAQEMEISVIRQHIELYVNRFTKDLGREGENAIIELLNVGASKGLMPAPRKDLFAF